MQCARIIVTTAMLFWFVSAPLCLGRTEKVLSGRELLRALRDKDAKVKSPDTESYDVNKDDNEKLDEIPGKETSPSVIIPNLTKKAASQSRVLHFPKDRSLGALRVPYTGVDKPVYPTFGTWEYFGEAKGDFVVPADTKLELVVGPQSLKLLPLLSALRPDDIHRLVIASSSDNPVRKLDEMVMSQLSHLTGLKELKTNINISVRGLRFIKRFKSLKYLKFGSRNLSNSGCAELAELESLENLLLGKCRITDEGMSHLAKLKSLRNLTIGALRVTDEGLHHLAKLTSLRELTIATDRVRGPGLAALANLPSLTSLTLAFRPQFSNNVFKHLKEITSLRKLQILDSPPTDEGLANLARLSQLEELIFYRSPINDKGFIHLKSMHSLKKLEFVGREIHDENLYHLKEIKRLESLKPLSISDKGLAYLAELGNLRCVHFGHRANITDSGLEHLGRLQFLEELKIGGEGITDEGMSHIAKLTNLKVLRLSSPITNEGLAKLTTLKSLNWLLLHKAKITISGLNHLNAMPNLARVGFGPVSQDGSVLNISQLTRLESLSLRHVPIRDEDLACLSKITHLKQLTMSSIKDKTISDKGVAHLANLTSLKWLTLVVGPDFTDEGLADIGNLKKLVFLQINGDGNFTDNGLQYLEGLTGLSYLRINSQNAFSNAALQHLRSSLPNLRTFDVIP